MFDFDAQYSTFSAIFVIVFVLILGVFVFQVFAGISQWSKNNNSPVLSVKATIVSKRIDVSHHDHNHDGAIHSSSSTTYFVTFQVESGDRIELRVKGKEYGILCEKDQGILTFQGTRYKGFEIKY